MTKSIDEPDGAIGEKRCFRAKNPKRTEYRANDKRVKLPPTSPRKNAKLAITLWHRHGTRFDEEFKVQ